MNLPTRKPNDKLLAEYARLRDLDGFTPQTRGQRLNGFVAEVLANYRLRARPNNRGHGEIDVAFQLDGTRFILEAKWEQDPVNEDPIIKLRDRVTKRLAGTVGVLLSMEGYTKPALEEMTRGQRLEVLLIDKSHLEAMLYGFLTPQQLLSALLDNAHFRGEPLTRIDKLRTETHSHIGVEWDWEISDTAVTPSDLFTVSQLFSVYSLDFTQLYERKSGEFFFDQPDGIVRLEQDSIKPTIHLGVPIGSFALDAEGIVAINNKCIAKFHNSKCTLTSLPPSEHQLLDTDWLLSGGSWSGCGGPAVLKQISSQKEIPLGDRVSRATVTDNGQIIAARASPSGQSLEYLIYSSAGDLMREIALPAGGPFNNGSMKAISDSLIAIVNSSSVRSSIHLFDIEKKSYECVVTSTLQLFQLPFRSIAGVLIFGVHIPGELPSDDRLGFFRLGTSEDAT